MTALFFEWSEALNTNNASCFLLCWLYKYSNQHKNLCFGLRGNLQAPRRERRKQCSERVNTGIPSLLAYNSDNKEFNCSHCLAWQMGMFIHILIHQTAEWNRGSKTEHADTSGTRSSVGSRTQPDFLWLCVLWLDYLICNEAWDLSEAFLAAGPLGVLFLVPTP